MRFSGYIGAYTFGSRFEEAPGTNPESLIAAAHAGCFSMALAGDLAAAGFSPTRVHTTAHVTVVKVDGGFGITKIALDCEAEVPKIDDAKFQELAAGAKVGCPVSKALAAVPEITLTARRG
jgi:osmotically inducible protein OsmC